MLTESIYVHCVTIFVCTGVSLAMLAHAYKCRCHIAMPDDAAQEKGAMLEALGECCPKGCAQQHIMSLRKHLGIS